MANELAMKRVAYQIASLRPKRPARSDRSADDIPDTPHGLQELPLERLVDLVAQPAHEHVDDVGLRVKAVLPHVGQDHGLRDDLARVPEQVLEQGEFLVREVDLPVTAAGGADKLAKARQQPERVKDVLGKVRTDGLLTTVGMINDQLVTYYWIITGATFIGLVVLIARLDTSDLQRPLLVALALIAVAAFVDTQAGLLSRPENFYWTQAMMAFAAIYFIGSAMMEGLLRALAQGMQYIISFIAVFSLSQTLGGLAGVAGLAAFQTIRAKVHLMDIGRELTLSDPAVAQAIQLRAAAYNGTIADPVLRQASGAGQLVQQAGRDAAIRQLARRGATFFVPLGIGAHLQRWGVRWAAGRGTRGDVHRRAGGGSLVCHPHLRSLCTPSPTVSRRSFIPHPSFPDTQPTAPQALASICAVGYT